ncbi:MAG: glycosyl hydrolase [Candidatus Azobacteroides sp.]|nr:glycosyl hydrolase [Candidatus Azobacteroides sp.]
MKRIFIVALSFCLCTLTHAQQATVYTTAKDTSLRISESETLVFKDAQQPPESQPCVFVDASKQFQSLIGIGGALTDASAETFAKLPEAVQQEFLTAYYDPQKGIGYTFGRTTMGSCDFSSDSYTYVADKDTALNTFNVQHDMKYRIPFIKRALDRAGGTLTLFISPWSPPAWMKDNNNVLQGGHLLPQYRQVWADYFVKFIQTYEKLGIPIWGLTSQNEPMAKQTWESCIYTAEEERDFVKYFLGPTLQKNGMADKKLMIWDHNRDLIYERVSGILNDPDAAKYVWGIGYHWYETWTGGNMMFDNQRRVYESFPDKPLVFTEGCAEVFNREALNEWRLGEKYGYSMINDFNNGTVAWTDWNVLLDENGGPNHVGNFCFAPIHADTRSGKLIYTNSYYYIGHFSKFIHPGAKRIVSSSNRNGLLTTAFLNTDGKIAVVVMNLTDAKINYNLYLAGKYIPVTGLPHSISTLMIQ